MNSAQAALQLVLQMKDEASAGIKNVGHEIQNVDKQAQQMQQHMGQGGEGGMFKGFLGGAAKLGMAIPTFMAAGQAVVGLGKAFIGGNAEFETYETQFGVLLKSSDAAKQRLQELAKFGAQTPFELPELVKADKVLTAFGLHGEQTAKKFGVSGSQILSTIGDVAAGTGTSFEELSVDFGKFASGSTGDAIARFQELGIATKEEMASWGLEFSKAGQLMTPADEAFGVLESHVRAKFGGMMDAQSKTFSGMLSNLQDWKGQALRTMGAPLFDALKPQLANLMTFLSSDKVMGAMANFSKGVGKGIANAATLIGKGIASIKGASAKVKGWWQNLVVPDAVRDSLGSLTGVIAKDLMGAIQKLKSGDFKGAISGIKDAFNDFKTLVMPNIGEMVTKAFQGLQGKSAQIGQFIGQWLPTIWAYFATATPRLINTLGQLFTQAIRGLTSILPGLLSTVGNLLMGLVQGIATGLPMAVSAFLSLLTTFFTSTLPGLFAALGELFGGIGAWVSTNGPAMLSQIGEVLGGMLAQLGDIISTQGPVLLSAIGSLIGNAFTWIVTQVPIITQAIFDFLGQIPSAIGTFLAENGPAILSGLGVILTNVTTWLGTAVPQLIGMIGEFIGQALAFIWNHGPEIIDGAGKVLDAIGKWILGTALPAIVNMLLAWGKAFLDWIGPIAAQIPGKLGELASNIWNWITKTAGDALTKASEIGGHILQGISDGLGNIASGLGDAVGKIWNWITQTAGDALGKAVEIGGKIVDGIGDGIKQWWNALGALGGKIIDVIWNGIKDFWSNIVSIGGKIVDAIGDGIKQWWTNITEGIKGLLGGIGAAVWDAAVAVGGAIFDAITFGMFNDKNKDKFQNSMRDWLHLADPNNPNYGPGAYVPGGAQPASYRSGGDVNLDNTPFIPDTSGITTATQAAQQASATIAKVANDVKVAMNSITVAVVSGGVNAIKAASTIGVGIRNAVAAAMVVGVWFSIGLNAAVGLAQGVAAGGGIAVANAISVGARVRATVAGMLSPGQFVAIGGYVGQGLAIGIAASSGRVIAAARAIANVVHATINAALQIHSPSKVMIDSGSEVSAGLAIGINEKRPAVLAMAQKLAGDVTGGLTKTIDATKSQPIAAVGAMLKDVIALAKSVVDKGTKDLMDGFQSLTSGASGMFDLLSKFNGEDVKMPGMKILNAFLTTAQSFIIGISDTIHVLKPDLTKANADMAGFMGSMADGVVKVASLLQQIGSKDFAMPGMKAASSFLSGLQSFVIGISDGLKVMTPDLTEVNAALADIMGRMVEGAGKTVSTLTSLVGFVKPADAAVIAFVDSLVFMVSYLGKFIGGWTEENVKLANLWQQGAGALLDGASKGLSLVQGLVKFIKPLDNNITSFVDALLFLVSKLGKGAQGWIEENAKVAGYWGQGAGAMVDGASKGLSLLSALVKFIKPADGNVTAFIDSLMFMVDTMAKRFAVFGEKGLEAASILATQAGAIVDMISKAVDGIGKLGTDTFTNTAAMITGGSNFFQAFNSLVNLYLLYVSDWTKAFKEQDASEIAQLAGTAIENLLRGVSGFAQIAEGPFGNIGGLIQGASNFFQAFSGLIDLYKTKVAEWTAAFSGDNGQIAATVAKTIGDIVSGISSALKLMVDLGGKDVVVATVGAVNKFWDTLDAFWVRFKARQEDWIANTGLVSSATTKIVNDVVADVFGAFAGLLKLGDPSKLPTKEALDAFFTGLDLFLAYMMTYALAWKDRATEAVAKVAGWIGDIATGISKVLDPLLKMADAHAVSEGDIEGAMYNVWFALNQFNKVMTGGTAGVAFQGSWMTTATKFASDVAGIFGQFADIMKAISGIGSGSTDLSGMVAAFETIRQAWLGLFGPADTTNSLLWLLTNDDTGFFTKLEDITNTKLMWLRDQVWRDRMLEMGETITKTLITIANPVYDQAKLLGQKLDDGIAAGIKDGTSVIEQAIKDAIQAGLDAAKAAGEIKSPSRLMAREIGMPLAQGVADGIMMGIGHVQHAMGQMTAATAGGGYPAGYVPPTWLPTYYDPNWSQPGLAGDTVGPMGIGSNSESNQTNINVYVSASPGTDGQKIGRDVAREISKATGIRSRLRKGK